ncbi:MAG TPA: GntR family transcriptional regulator [Gemmatimonadales bacterium]|nr:GntR family transcriptional regulator [Gemmatimonadales bacterium]
MSRSSPLRSKDERRVHAKPRIKQERRSAGTAADQPRYQQIADELIARISAGRYPVGELLPTEMELCKLYGISRSTVREALRRVRDAGLISRRRRTGTKVIAQTPPVIYRQPTNSIRDLLQYADETRIEILSEKRVICDARLAALLECREGHAWLRLDSLRRVPDDPRPICMTTSYVDAGLPDIDKHLESNAGPISAMLERTYGIRIARIEQSIQAIRLGKQEAKLLRADVDSPALRAMRRYYREDGTLIELSDAIHPGDRFTYVTSLVRE